MEMLLYSGVYLLGVFISAISQVMLKKAAQREYGSTVREYLNPLVIFAYVLFFLTTLMTIYAYKVIPISLGPVLEATSYLYVTFFGVTMDELFALSDETRMERIQNMLWDERTLNPKTAEAERAFLLEKGRREKDNGVVYRLQADIEYQLSEEHRRAAV